MNPPDRIRAILHLSRSTYCRNKLWSSQYHAFCQWGQWKEWVGNEQEPEDRAGENQDQ